MTIQFRAHIAVAIAALSATLSAPAFAQSSVGISGSIDLGVFRGFDKTKNVGQISRSNLAFAGTEDLGNGLQATFRLSTRFSADTGISTDTLGDVGKKPFWHGESTVGLKGSFGSLKVGRHLDVINNNSWAYDPWYYFDSIASPAWHLWSWNYTTDRVSNNGNPEYGRLNNGIFYSSPKMGGVTVHLHGAFEKSAAAGAGQGNAYGGSLNYDQGPISVMAANQRNSSGDTETFVGLKYTVGGGLDLMGAYDNTTFKGAAAKSKNTAYTLGASYSFGSARVMASYGTVDTSPKLTALGLGGQYFLSKRTNVYLSLGQKKTSGSATQTASGVGINHSF